LYVVNPTHLLYFRGHLKMESPDGQTFEIKIPAFVLESKAGGGGDEDDQGPPAPPVAPYEDP
jgi:hypothetical protein